MPPHSLDVRDAVGLLSWKEDGIKVRDRLPSTPPHFGMTFLGLSGEKG